MITHKGVLLPQDFAKALQADEQALSAFESMRPSYQKRYAALIEAAKKPETRERRIKRALEMAQRHRNPKEKSLNPPSNPSQSPFTKGRPLLRPQIGMFTNVVKELPLWSNSIGSGFQNA